MKLNLFDYRLPADRVAYYPVSKREGSRLLVLRRGSGDLEHSSFLDLADFFKKGDLLVLNNSKVVPARIRAIKKTGGVVELLFLNVADERSQSGEYLAAWSSSKPLKSGAELEGPGNVQIGVKGIESSVARLTIAFPQRYSSFRQWLSDWGRMPLPPYIKRDAEPADFLRYQTVYAEREGSVAAPTAGLHFTASLLNQLKEKGVEVAHVTLHVGLGTFKPVVVEEVEVHQMYAEWFEVGREAAEKINRAKRVVAVGTTTVRALESASWKFDERRFHSAFDCHAKLACHPEPKAKDPDSLPDLSLRSRTRFTLDRSEGAQNRRRRVRADSGWTSLFIYPGYSFKAVDALITNFHYPKSTLMMLTAAFAGRELLLKAYEEAIARKYRLLSYGDAMLII